MDDAGAVRAVERVSDLNCDGERLTERDGAALEPSRERLALKELQNEKIDIAVTTNVVNAADVGVIERRSKRSRKVESLASASARTLIATSR